MSHNVQFWDLFLVGFLLSVGFVAGMAFRRTVDKEEEWIEEEPERKFRRYS